MNEQSLPVSEQLGVRAGLDSLFGEEEQTDELVLVANGPYTEYLPVANLTVGQVRERFADRLDLDPQSQAILNGREADEQTVLRAGQVLAFVRRAGEKGGGP